MLPSGLLSLPLEELRIDVSAPQSPQAAQLPVRPKGKDSVGGVWGSEGGLRVCFHLCWWQQRGKRSFSSAVWNLGPGCWHWTLAFLETNRTSESWVLYKADVRISYRCNNSTIITLLLLLIVILVLLLLIVLLGRREHVDLGLDWDTVLGKVHYLTLLPVFLGFPSDLQIWIEI